jgi:hypothetical protein
MRLQLRRFKRLEAYNIQCASGEYGPLGDSCRLYAEHTVHLSTVQMMMKPLVSLLRVRRSTFNVQPWVGAMGPSSGSTCSSFRPMFHLPLPHPQLGRTNSRTWRTAYVIFICSRFYFDNVAYLDFGNCLLIAVPPIDRPTQRWMHHNIHAYDATHRTPSPDQPHRFVLT